jgi:hypothetical protein
MSPSAKAHSFWKIFSSASHSKTTIKFDQVIEDLYTTSKNNQSHARMGLYYIFFPLRSHFSHWGLTSSTHTQQKPQIRQEDWHQGNATVGRQRTHQTFGQQ